MLQKHLATFTEPQYRWLQSTARKLGVAVTELLRRIVDEKRGAK
jgi:hypothetical protein